MASPRFEKNRISKAKPLAIVYREIHQLQPDAKNPRVHSKKQIQQVARSIEAFGFNVPFNTEKMASRFTEQALPKARRIVEFLRRSGISLTGHRRSMSEIA